MNRATPRLLLSTTLLLLCACSARRKDAGERPAARAAGADEPRIKGAAFVATPELATVRFPYDRDELTPEARRTLKKNAAVIGANRSWEVLVEGHCDERGTVAYNLALGQKRAKAVRDYYLALGVAGSRVATRSLGEESGECAEATDACWERNRRAVSKVRAAVAVRPGGAKRHE
ncbi:MAG: OmpA family protein [Elusimicrobiota bacterium]|nr:OmpA family protein [Elusimicrobiota bacterium]